MNLLRWHLLFYYALWRRSLWQSKWFGKMFEWYFLSLNYTQHPAALWILCLSLYALLFFQVSKKLEDIRTRFAFWFYAISEKSLEDLNQLGRSAEALYLLPLHMMGYIIIWMMSWPWRACNFSVHKTHPAKSEHLFYLLKYWSYVVK